MEVPSMEAIKIGASDKSIFQCMEPKLECSHPEKMNGVFLSHGDGPLGRRRIVATIDHLEEWNFLLAIISVNKTKTKLLENIPHKPVNDVNLVCRHHSSSLEIHKDQELAGSSKFSRNLIKMPAEQCFIHRSFEQDRVSLEVRATSRLCAHISEMLSDNQLPEWLERAGAGAEALVLLVKSIRGISVQKLPPAAEFNESCSLMFKGISNVSVESNSENPWCDMPKVDH
ncbi:hypothetical protein Tco_0280685 [Tanacetum coccineum]